MVLKNPRVSIITAVFNHERYLPQAIESVLSQDYPNRELILWDDGSTDRSPQIAQGYADKYPEQIKYFEHPEHANRGQEATRNAAVRKTTGELIALLDSDDFYEPNKLSLLVPCFEEPRVGLAYGKAEVLIEATGQRFPSGINNEPAGDVFDALVLNNFISASAVVFRRACFRDGVSFDTRFKTMGEYPLWIKIAKDWDFAFVPQVVSVWREHGKNLGTLLSLKAKEELVQYSENMLSGSEFAMHRNTLTKIRAIRKYDFAHELYSMGEYEKSRSRWLEVLNDYNAPKKMRFKSIVMMMATFLGKSANEKLFRMKRYLWERSHPFARIARKTRQKG